jgi:Ca2+-binding EF-hand superfamily protein
LTLPYRYAHFHDFFVAGDVMRALGQNPTESEVKKLVHEHRADDRVPFEVFLPIMQVGYSCIRVKNQDADPG